MKNTIMKIAPYCLTGLLATTPLHAAQIIFDFASSTPASSLVDGDTSASGNELRWANIATSGGITLDLVATISGGTYTASNTSNNGTNGDFGQLNLNSGVEVQMTFRLVDQSDDTSVIADLFEFVVLDLDTGTGGENFESIGLAGHDGSFDGYTTTIDSELSVGGTAALPTFTATVNGSGSDTPDDPNDMTPLQSNRTVSLQFSEASEFGIDMSMLPGGGGGRNMLFAGEVTFNGETFTTIPEPSSTALLGLDGLALILRRRR
jgi:hypothetical protein